MPGSKTLRRAVASRLLPTVLLCGFAFCDATAAELPRPPATLPIPIGIETRSVVIRNSESVLEYPDWLTSVTCRDAAVVRISAVRPNQIRVHRMGTGTTTLIAKDRSDHQYSIDVIVRDGDGDR